MAVDLTDLRAAIEAVPASPSCDDLARAAPAIEATVAQLQLGRARVATPAADPSAPYEVHAWLRQAIVLYFRLLRPGPMPASWATFWDLVPQRQWCAQDQVRAVPPAAVRVGAYVGPGAVLMPSFVNIGAYIGGGTMVDTWATVGSCAQIGADVHLSGGVGIGGVLEPAGARPVVIEQGAFIGSRAVIVEGVRVGARAVIGAGVVLTASSAIVDVTCAPARSWRGEVPAGAVVIPGNRTKTFAAGDYAVPCALVVGQRSAQTDLKTSLTQALRQHAVAI